MNTLKSRHINSIESNSFKRTIFIKYVYEYRTRLQRFWVLGHYLSLSLFRSISSSKYFFWPTIQGWPDRFGKSQVFVFFPVLLFK